MAACVVLTPFNLPSMASIAFIFSIIGGVQSLPSDVECDMMEPVALSGLSVDSPRLVRSGAHSLAKCGRKKLNLIGSVAS